MKYFLATCVSLFITFDASAGPRNSPPPPPPSPRRPQISGQISNGGETTKVDAFPELQDSITEYFKRLNDVVQQAAKGAVPVALPALNVNQFSYLNAAYLYCSDQNGTCPVVLDALLEVDVINSRLAKQAACPSLTGFWTQWVKTDMEPRQEYQVRTGFLGATNEFRLKERPKYIKCVPTVQSAMGDAIAAGQSDSDYFQRRYAGDSDHKKNMATMVELLTEIKSKVPNIITAVGSR